MAGMKPGTAARTNGYLFERGTCLGTSDALLLERFVARRDETAFEALVVRHGRAVLAACNDVLCDPYDAEDAFQATFMILARKAGTLWVRDSLAAWLHRVAHRVAVEANRRNGRRRAEEQTGYEIDAVPTADPEPGEALWPVLHEEVDRLPEKYRTAIILCDLEGLTREQAAGRLGWPPGTVAGRLARARDLASRSTRPPRPLRGQRSSDRRRQAPGAFCCPRHLDWQDRSARSCCREAAVANWPGCRRRAKRHEIPECRIVNR